MNEKGFTLIEVVVSIVILGIIMCLTASMLKVYQEAYVVSKNDTNSFEDANLAMTMMVRELRQQIGLTNTSTSTQYNDGTQTVTFLQVGNTLVRRVSVGGQQRDEILVNNVSNFSISPTSGSNLKQCDIRLDVFKNEADPNAPDSSIALDDSVTLRN